MFNPVSSDVANSAIGAVDTQHLKEIIHVDKSIAINITGAVLRGAVSAEFAKKRQEIVDVDVIIAVHVTRAIIVINDLDAADHAETAVRVAEVILGDPGHVLRNSPENRAIAAGQLLIQRAIRHAILTEGDGMKATTVFEDDKIARADRDAWRIECEPVCAHDMNLAIVVAEDQRPILIAVGTVTGNAAVVLDVFRCIRRNSPCKTGICPVERG